MAPKAAKKPLQKRRKPEDWDGPVKIQKPEPGTPDDEVDAWVAAMQSRYDTLNKADRQLYQTVRKARNARLRYAVRKEDPLFLIMKAETQSVSNFFTSYIKFMNNFKVS